MKKQTVSIIAAVFAVGSVILAVVSFILLPDVVITQISFNESGVTTMPKLFAVMIPTVLGIGGAIAAFLIKEEKQASKALIVSGAGLLVFVLMLAVNMTR